MAAIFYTLATLKARLAEADKERGATAVEYGVIVALLSVVIVIGLVAFGQPVRDIIDAAFIELGL